MSKFLALGIIVYAVSLVSGVLFGRFSDQIPELIKPLPFVLLGSSISFFVIDALGFGYKKEKPFDKMLDFFRDWQRQNPCPICKAEALDFMIKKGVSRQFVCTNCITFFDLKEVKA